MAPLGVNLNLDQLLTALKWKLENEGDGNSPFGIGDPSHSQHRRNWSSTWSQRILESEHVTSLLKHRLNVLPAINHLPCEILGEIFLYLHGEYSDTSFKLRREEPDLNRANSWFKLTHVCRFWRRTAHDTKALWRRITIDDTHPFPASLAIYSFTLSHPLVITLEHQFSRLCRSEREQMHKFYTLLYEHTDRISGLYLRGDFPDMAWTLLQMLMPNLLELELSFSEPDRGRRIRHYWDRTLLGSNGNMGNILDGHSSALRKLSFTNYVWPEVTFSAITHLYLTNEFYDPDDPDRGDNFLVVLSSLSSSLQVLYLEALRTFFESDLPTILPLSARPVMQVLKYIEMLQSPAHDEAYSSLILLYNLSLPAIETLIWDSAWSREVYSDLVDYFDLPPYEYLARVTSLITFTMKKWDRWVITGRTLYFDPHEVTFSHWEIWQTLLPNIVTLVLDGNQGPFKDDIRGVLKRFTALKHLHLEAYSQAPLVLSYLEKKRKDGSNLDFLPHLERFDIYAGNHDFEGAKKVVSERMIRRGLQPLELAADQSMNRSRHHLQTNYTLRFEMGHIHQFSFEDIL